MIIFLGMYDQRLASYIIDNWKNYDEKNGEKKI